jgi:hypothetical protein
VPDATPTAQEIEDAIARDLAEGVMSATGDGESATAMDPRVRLEALRELQARQTARQTARPNGWGGCGFGRVVPPGGA